MLLQDEFMFNLCSHTSAHHNNIGGLLSREKSEKVVIKGGKNFDRPFVENSTKKEAVPFFDCFVPQRV